MSAAALVPIFAAAARRRKLPTALTGLLHWLRPGPEYCFTDEAGTVPAGADDAVAAWRDHEGEIVFTQATEALRPLLRYTDGVWSVQGDDGNDIMGSSLTLTGACTLAIGSRQMVASNARPLNSGTVNGLLGGRRPDGIRAFVASMVADQDSPDPEGYQRWILTKASGGNWVCYRNGVDITTAASSTDWGLVGLGAGTQEQLMGSFTGDVVFTSSRLTAAEVTLLDTYLATREV